jgi:phosphoserine phosphatase
LAKAEDAYASGTVDNRQVSELDAAGWAGVPEDQVSGWLDGLPLVSGITETVAWCRQNGLVPVLATLAWSPVGSYLTARFGFHAFSGPRLETTDGRYTGRVVTSTSTANEISPSPRRESWGWLPARAGLSGTAAPTCRCSHPSG